MSISSGKREAVASEQDIGVVCSVCNKAVSSSTRASPDGCSHLFHSSCIESWAKIDSKCPECKIPFQEILASSLGSDADTKGAAAGDMAGSEVVGERAGATDECEVKNDEAEPQVCTICYDDIAIGMGARLDKCTHEFHPQCIKKWGTEKSNRCPLCRARFHLIEWNCDAANRDGGRSLRGRKIVIQDLDQKASDDEDSDEGMDDVIDADDQPCMNCGSFEESSVFLLCDACNRPCHLDCTEPKLTCVPDGDWFCNECIEEQNQAMSLRALERLRQAREQIRLRDIRTTTARSLAQRPRADNRRRSRRLAPSTRTPECKETSLEDDYSITTPSLRASSQWQRRGNSARAQAIRALERLRQAREQKRLREVRTTTARSLAGISSSSGVASSSTARRERPARSIPRIPSRTARHRPQPPPSAYRPTPPGAGSAQNQHVVPGAEPSGRIEVVRHSYKLHIRSSHPMCVRNWTFQAHLCGIQGPEDVHYVRMALKRHPHTRNFNFFALAYRYRDQLGGIRCEHQEGLAGLGANPTSMVMSRDSGCGKEIGSVLVTDHAISVVLVVTGWRGERSSGAPKVGARRRVLICRQLGGMVMEKYGRRFRNAQQFGFSKSTRITARRVQAPSKARLVQMAMRRPSGATSGASSSSAKSMSRKRMRPTSTPSGSKAAVPPRKVRSVHLRRNRSNGSTVNRSVSTRPTAAGPSGPRRIVAPPRKKAKPSGPATRAKTNQSNGKRKQNKGKVITIDMSSVSRARRRPPNVNPPPEPRRSPPPAAVVASGALDKSQSPDVKVRKSTESMKRQVHRELSHWVKKRLNKLKPKLRQNNKSLFRDVARRVTSRFVESFERKHGQGEPRPKDLQLFQRSHEDTISKHLEKAFHRPMRKR